MFARLSKLALFERSETDSIAQTGGEIIDADFRLPTIESEIVQSFPSIETFVAADDGTISAMGTNRDLITAWRPAVDALVQQMRGWASANDVELVGDAYVTASITPAGEVNGEAHFDDDQFVPDAGVGLVAIVGDLGGPTVASTPIPHAPVRPHQALEVDEQVALAYAQGAFERIDYGPNELVALPQFGQLHSGPGPSEGIGDARHLLVYRATTVPK